MKYKRIKLLWLTLALVAGCGLVAANFAFGQFEYYDPYSNSNIDYFPMNPVNTSPSRNPGINSTPSTGSTQKTAPDTSGTSKAKTETSVSCKNKPNPNPTNTRSVEIRDASGKVFYLSPPKEEVSGVRAYPESSEKIFKIIYGDNGVQKDESEIGVIVEDSGCYPKYGYIKNETPAQSSDVVKENVMPPNMTAARLDPKTGKVYNEKTGELIPDARYDVAARKIYYQDTRHTFGKVFTDTTGYVNIQIHVTTETPPDAASSMTSLPAEPEAARPAFTKKCPEKTTLLFNEAPYHFCYRADALVVETTTPQISNLKITSSAGETVVFTITHYKTPLTVDDITQDWTNMKKKKVNNKYVSGFTYTFTQNDLSIPSGAFLVSKKTKEFVHIQFPETADNLKSTFIFPKEFKTLTKTFRFLE